MEKLAELELWKRELQVEAHTLIDFFCEDKETMKLDECFQIFRDFCTRFNRAVKVWLLVLPCSQVLGIFIFLLPDPVLCLWQQDGHRFFGFRTVWPGGMPGSWQGGWEVPLL